MPPRQLVLHIGMPKTGTSAIQSWLARNSAALHAQGIAYLKFPAQSGEDRIASGNGGPLAAAVLEGHASTRRAAQHLIEEEGLDSFFGDCNRAIISSEMFSVAEPGRVEWLHGFFARQRVSVSLVVYCRSLYDYAYSSYQQAVKRGGETVTFRDYVAVNDLVPDYQRLLHWKEIFGPSIAARLYDRARADLIGDFVQACRIIDARGLDLSQATVNRGLTSVELEQLRLLNARHGGTLSTLLSDALIYTDPHKRPDRPIWPDVVRDLETRFSDHVRRVNEAFFSGGEQLGIAPAQRDPDPPPRVGEAARTLEILVQALAAHASAAARREAALMAQLLLARAGLAMKDLDWPRALRRLLQAATLAPDNARIHRLLAQVQRKLGKQARPAEAPGR